MTHAFPVELAPFEAPITGPFYALTDSLISLDSLVGSEVETRRKTLVWGLAASLRFHW
jgi:hypothetical protein